MSDTVIELGAKETFDTLKTNPNAVLIDIRSSQEFLFVGHPKGAVSVPWIDEPDWIIDPHFTANVRRVMLGGTDDEGEVNPPMAILICRSGRRSHDAGLRLLEEGMRNIYHVVDGFEGPLNDDHKRSSIAGWRFEGLPWEQC
jgi:rhodanese-related sulfurtransferase